MAPSSGLSAVTRSPISVQVDGSVFSDEAILKACYWFSREYSSEIVRTDPHSITVTLTPILETTDETGPSAKDAFLRTLLDFALREKIDAKTSGLRDLLLAKAFSESGVLEDEPKGIFGDKVEEEKPNGMFKVLNNFAQ